MAPLPPVPNVIRVDMLWSDQSDGKALTRLHWSYSGGAPSSANCASLASDIRAAAATNLIPHLTNNGNLHEVLVQDLSSATGASGLDNTVVAGTRTGASLPQGVAVLINHTIARRYRGGKPRSYLPLFSISDYNPGGSWLSTSVASLNVDFPAFVSAVNASTAGSTSLTAHVNVSYYSGFTNVPYGSPTKYRRVPTVRGTPLVDVITASTCNAIPGSQRRRNRP